MLGFDFRRRLSFAPAPTQCKLTTFLIANRKSSHNEKHKHTPIIHLRKSVLELLPRLRVNPPEFLVRSGRDSAVRV